VVGIGNLIAAFKQTWKRIHDDDIFGLSAQLAYFFLLSLFPLLIFIVTLFPYLPITHRDILAVLQDFAPEGTMELIESNLYQVSEKNGKLLSFGIIGTLWSASNGINAIIRALNKAYDVKEGRSFFIQRGMAVILTIAMILVIVVALLLPVFGKHIGVFLFSQLNLSDQFLSVWNTLRWLVSSIIIFCIFVGLYWLAPSKRLSCRSALPGAVFATVGWILTSLAFSFYVGNFGNYSATYGSIGAIIVLMIWFYISGVILILGGEVNAYYSRKKKC
jgi:membrane protein